MNNDIANLMGITEQQLDILKAIDISSEKGKARPKGIEEAYQRLVGKGIQKPNLFAQLRELQKLEFVAKADGSYTVNKARVKQSLLKRKQELSEEMQSCDDMIKQADQVFKNNNKNVIIKYLARDERYKKAFDKMRTAKVSYSISHIPTVMYSEVLQNLKGRAEYSQMIIENCQRGKLKMKYLVLLKPRRIFYRAFQFFKDKERAYKEAEGSYEKLIKLLDVPNLEFRYLDADVESFKIVEDDVTSTLFLPLRASIYRQEGSVMIEDRTISDAYKEMFERIYGKAAPLTPQLVRKIAKEQLKDLRKVMDQLASDALIALNT